jgi:hypothetical protein
MDKLRRWIGGGSPQAKPDGPPPDPSTIAADEREYELELARSEQERLDDLAQRQLRYADYAWEPPRQGGDRRADDGDEPGE